MRRGMMLSPSRIGSQMRLVQRLPQGCVFYLNSRMRNLAARGPNQAAGTLTNSDATNRWYLDPGTGLYKAAAANQPRFAADGLLLEPAATQLLTGTMPTTFTTAAGWTHTQLAATPISSDGAIGPTGAMEMDGIVANNTSTQHYVAATATYSRTNNVPYSFDVFVKPGNKTWVQLWFVYFSAGPTYVAAESAYFNLSGSGAVGTSTVDSAEIEKVTDGLYRVKIRDTYNNAAATLIRPAIYVADSDTDNTFAGDNSTVNLWVYGAYLRQTAFFDQPIFTGSATRTTEAGSLTFPINAALAAALSTGGKGTIIVDWYASSANGFSSNLVSTSAAILLYTRTTDPYISATDGTNFPNITNAQGGNWTAGSRLLNVWRFPSSSGKQLLSLVKASGTIINGSEANYDGDILGSTTLTIARVLLDTQMFLKSIKIYNRVLSDSDILRHWN